MDAKLTAAHLTADRDEQLLLLRVYEQIHGAVQRNIPAASCFLSEREQMLAEKLLHGMPVSFFGGLDTAERRVCRYTPDWLSEDEPAIAAVRAEFFEADPLTHRDILGALMGAGIKRETVGDIYVGTGYADFLLLRKMLPYVLQNLTSAGRTKLTLHEIPISELLPPERKVKCIHDTVPSLRLDSIVSSGFSVGRGKAAEMIESGRTELDHALCLKPDRQVTEGCTISVRGLGRIQLTEVGGTTKKGRLSITISRYL